MTPAITGRSALGGRPVARVAWSWVAPVAATVAAATTLLPWLRTGSTSRSAFEVLGALRAAGLMVRTPARLFFFALALVPGSTAVAWLLRFVGYVRTSAMSAALSGSLVATTSLATRDVAHQRAASGTMASAVLGLAAAAVAVGVTAMSPMGASLTGHAGRAVPRPDGST